MRGLVMIAASGLLGCDNYRPRLRSCEGPPVDQPLLAAATFGAGSSPNNFPIGARRGTSSPSTLSVAAMGIARNAPTTPQMNHQNNTKIITASALSLRRFP